MGMYEQIARNKRRTFLMLAVFVLLIAGVAVALGFFFKAGVAIVPIAIFLAIAMAWTSYFASDRIALAASRAKPADGPEYARYHNLVEGLCIAAGLPKPRLYVVDDPAPNALADASGVQLTRYPPGLISALKKLQDDQAVVHHATRATAQMWIESPLERDRQAERAEARGDASGAPKKGTWLNRAFDTHPPLEE